MTALRRRAIFAAVLPLSAALALSPTPARADVVAYFANGEEARPIEFGDGRDGAFADGPAQTGISVVGATITIDTSVKSVFQFTSFSLTAGHTLVATGGSPLIVRVQGAANVAGTLRVDGAAGGDAAAGAAGAGGTAGAGGGNGGDGGVRPPTTVESTDGLPRSGRSIGGSHGPNNAAPGSQQEGGGGCNGPGATGGAAYPAGAASCPLGRTAIAAAFENSFYSPSAGQRPGGGGGGGGGTYLLAGNGINGAGGGGAGGALLLVSGSDLTLAGTISANGGAGGNGSAPGIDYGSSGGGGAGGSLWLQSATRILGAGTLAVSGGAGGQDAGAFSIGGNGSRGVIRLDATANAFTGTFTPAGAADLVYPVYPMTVEFTLHAGPACGTLASNSPRGGDQTRRDLAGTTLVWSIAFAIAARRRRKLN